MFGHSWVSQYGDDPAGAASDTWSAVLAGLSNAQIAHGLRSTMALGSDWPPSAPRFRSMCFAIPSLAEAMFAFRQKSTDAFTRQMWIYIDSYAYRNADADKGGRMIRDAYELACRFVMEGGQLPDEAVAFIEPGKRKPLDDASPEVRRRAGEARSKSMADIAQMFGGEV